jgi:FeS assembly protein IscX
MKWTDVQEITEKLIETYPDIDPKTIRFTDLHQWVLKLPGFLDDPKHCNEKVLEAIQMIWMEEI